MSSLWVKFNNLSVKKCSKIGIRFYANVVEAFKKECLVPDIIEKAPDDLIEVCYKSGVSASLGNTLTPTNVKEIPEVKWPSDEKCMYTLYLADADAPCRKKPFHREWQHWLVGNIPGCNMCEGQTLTEYVPSIPRDGTGLHRYIFLVYQQLGKVCFDDIPLICAYTAEGRDKFSIKQFACKFEFGDPVAGNFYQAEFNCYVNKVLIQLGIKIRDSAYEDE